MLKRAMVLMLGFLFLLGGCATTGYRQNDLEIQGLKNQISALEAQLQCRDEEVNSLKASINKAMPQKMAPVKEVKSRPKPKQIQIALANAGYNPGPIDGSLGRQTKDAIRAFQRANGLKPDGKVGKLTWTLLKKYLYQKVK